MSTLSAYTLLRQSVLYLFFFSGLCNFIIDWSVWNKTMQRIKKKKKKRLNFALIQIQ